MPANAVSETATSDLMARYAGFIPVSAVFRPATPVLISTNAVYRTAGIVILPDMPGLRTERPGSRTAIVGSLPDGACTCAHMVSQWGQALIRPKNVRKPDASLYRQRGERQRSSRQSRSWIPPVTGFDAAADGEPDSIMCERKRSVSGFSSGVKPMTR